MLFIHLRDLVRLVELGLIECGDANDWASHLATMSTYYVTYQSWSRSIGAALISFVKRYKIAISRATDKGTKGRRVINQHPYVSFNFFPWNLGPDNDQINARFPRRLSVWTIRGVLLTIMDVDPNWCDQKDAMAVAVVAHQSVCVCVTLCCINQKWVSCVTLGISRAGRLRHDTSLDDSHTIDVPSHTVKEK